MVDRREMRRIALRYDTAMSRAMLRALGCRHVRRLAGKPGMRPRLAADPYEGLREAFMNRGRAPFER